MASFGDRIAALREERGWARRELARRSGLHEQHLLKIEQGLRKRVESDTIISLACVFEVSADYLLGLTDDPTPPKRARRKRATPASAADEEASVGCPACGVGDGAHDVHCRVLAAHLAADPVAQENLRRGRLITAKLMELAGQKEDR